jgi:predicted ribosome quality control (RQC) complex YloA/Tae2 family protein
MTYDLSGVDVFFLAKELSEIECSKIDKIVQIDRKLFLFRLFADKKKKNIRLLVPELINITEQKYASPLVPMGFCSFLRKYLQNTRIKKVYQYEFERILIIEFESLKNGELVLILEFFKPGNLILCKRDTEKRDTENTESHTDRLIILNSLERQEFKARKIEARADYIFPPKQNNPIKMAPEEIKQIISSSDKVLGKTLAMDFSLGGVYAEEIIVRSGLDKNAKELSDAQIKKLMLALEHFFSEKIDCSKLNDKIYPVKMKSLETAEHFDSFNQGLDSINIVTEAPKVHGKKVVKSKTEALLKIQQKRINELEKEIEESQKCGEFIYEHYQEFQKLLDSIKTLRDEGKSFDAIEKILAKNKHFKSMDASKKTINMQF